MAVARTAALRNLSVDVETAINQLCEMKSKSEVALLQGRESANDYDLA